MPGVPQAPAVTHARKAATVTSVSSRQNALRRTPWIGCSSGTVVDPMSNIPAGISRMPTGHGGGVVQAPATQVWPNEHARLHPPQWLGSASMLRHVLPQRA